MIEGCENIEYSLPRPPVYFLDADLLPPRHQARLFTLTSPLPTHSLIHYARQPSLHPKTDIPTKGCPQLPQLLLKKEENKVEE